jgi:hypothetical protein
MVDREFWCRTLVFPFYGGSPSVLDCQTPPAYPDGKGTAKILILARKNPVFSLSEINEVSYIRTLK